MLVLCVCVVLRMLCFDKQLRITPRFRGCCYLQWKRKWRKVPGTKSKWSDAVEIRDRLNLRTKGKSCRICSPADRNCDVAEPREFHHNIALWAWCGTLPEAPYRPLVFAEWAWLPHGLLTSSSTPIRRHPPPSYRTRALVRYSTAWGQSTSRTLSPLPDIQTPQGLNAPNSWHTYCLRLWSVRRQWYCVRRQLHERPVSVNCEVKSARTIKNNLVAFAGFLLNRLQAMLTLHLPQWHKQQGVISAFTCVNVI